MELYGDLEPKVLTVLLSAGGRLGGRMKFGILKSDALSAKLRDTDLRDNRLPIPTLGQGINFLKSYVDTSTCPMKLQPRVQKLTS